MPFAATGAYYARLKASASATAAVDVLFLRQTTFDLMGLQAFTIGPAAQTLVIGPATPAADGNYHLQVG